MIKNWKTLFVKTDEQDLEKPTTKNQESLSFPLNSHSPIVNQSSEAFTAMAINDPVVNEVLQVYEKGLDSINMPGYDFYEFYKAISSVGMAGEQTYQMAYQMARTMDNTVTPQKLLSDAEFYISKIGEVHGQYVSQGQKKLYALQEEKSSEKNKLTSEIDQASLRITQLRSELQQLESEVNQKRTLLTKIDENVYPREKVIQEKMNANDLARKASIEKLNTIKEGIHRFIK